MGFYTGDGVVTAGGESYNTLKNFYYFAAFSVLQKCRSTTTVKHGVSLQTAQAETASSNLQPVATANNTDAIVWNANGTRKSVSYSQIGDSNLYDLTIVEETFTASRASSTVINI